MRLTRDALMMSCSCAFVLRRILAHMLSKLRRRTPGGPLLTSCQDTGSPTVGAAGGSYVDMSRPLARMEIDKPLGHDRLFTQLDPSIRRAAPEIYLGITS